MPAHQRGAISGRFVRHNTPEHPNGPSPFCLHQHRWFMLFEILGSAELRSPGTEHSDAKADRAPAITCRPTHQSRGGCRLYTTAYFLSPRVKVGGRIGAMALVHQKLPKGPSEHGTAGYELDKSASVRPIFTLQHAGVSGGIREPFVFCTVGHIDHGYPKQMGYVQMASNKSAGTATTKAAPPCKPASTPRSHHEMPVSLSGA
jgi:hypothetical protein